MTFPAIPLYFNTFFTHFTQSVKKLTQFYTFMRPVGGGACAAHTTFPHTFHKASHAPHTSFTKLHTAQHTLTHLSHSPHKVFTNPSQINPPLPPVAAALAPLLQPLSQRSHKGFTKNPINPIKVTQSPYKAPSKVTRGRSGPAGRGFPRQGS